MGTLTPVFAQKIAMRETQGMADGTRMRIMRKAFFVRLRFVVALGGFMFRKMECEARLFFIFIVLLLLVLPVPFSPALDALIDHVSCDTISDQLHGDTKYLNILVPAFIVKKQHILVVNATISVDPLEMCSLAARVYLQMIEEVNCA